MRCALAAVVVAALGTGAIARPSDFRTERAFGFPPSPLVRPAELTFTSARLCAIIETEAATHGMDPHFFARLIWRESRFDIGAISPAGAEGVAQFMPGTAAERGLVNPWDPRLAIPASAAYLSDLKQQFGNFGLAAAAYNGGPSRVAAWLAGRGGLPGETLAYVNAITFRPAEWFRTRTRTVEPRPLDPAMAFDEACAALPVIATRAFAGANPRPWGVQIAAGITHRAAVNAYHRVRRQASALIGDDSPIVVRAGRGGGRRLYSARVGTASQSAAQSLCARLKRVGLTCVVRRN